MTRPNGIDVVLASLLAAAVVFTLLTCGRDALWFGVGLPFSCEPHG